MVLNNPSSPLGEKINTLASSSNLTPGQLLLWLGQKLNPETPLYNMVFSFTIQGEIDPNHFQRAFQTLVDRSDILRLTITEIEGVPHQQVMPSRAYSLPVIDFSTPKSTGADPVQVSHTWMAEQSTRLLNLADCLFDSALLKLGPEQFIWYFNQHHLITDNWSVALLYRQLQTYYGQSLQGTLAPSNDTLAGANGTLSASSSGTISTAADLPAYVAYAESEQTQPPSAWQQNAIQQAITHWQQKQITLPPSVPLYGPHPDGATGATTRTERIHCDLGPARSAALRALAQTPAAQTLSIHQSQFNLFLTLVFAYLYRVSGQRELAIAAPAHNRPTPILKETPGLFMELFPLQVTIAPEETFTSLVGKVAQESMAFLRYAQAGVSHHGLSRDINVVLSYVNVTFPDFHGLPVHTDWIHPGHGDSQHHLRLEVQDFDATGNFTLQFDFNCDLIAPTQRQWASEHFCQLLDAWLADGQQPIGAITMLAVEEQARLGVGSHPSADPSPGPGEDQRCHTSTLVARFQQQVALNPTRTAVVFGDHGEHTLTYAELDRQANQLAHYLGHQGIEKGMLVGLFLERSMAMVVSILGILKAGAAYVPLDPAYPAARVAFMVADAQVVMVLTQSELRDKLPDGTNAICLEDQRRALAPQPTHAPQVGLTAQDLAYVLFTSGSTGQPKGVMVEHRNVLALLQGFEQTAPAGETLRGTALCSHGFDVSVWELFSNLCFGGTVHLVPAAVVTSHDRLAQYVIDQGITSAYIPPALLPTVIQVWEQQEKQQGEQQGKQQGEQLIPLDRILVGVEPIPQQLLQRYRQRLPQLRIVNGYGPTETTICATFYCFDRATDPQGIVPIGRALPGYGVYVVNAHGQPVPMGVKGEIVIGGAGLSRGYLHRPELMAERFMDHPFGAGQLYKTGDQARYLPDGNLEFLGRLDHQVKIRGFRVELREVEAALNQHGGIQQAVVIAEPTAGAGAQSPQSPQSPQSLLAYVVTTAPALPQADLRDFLHQKLPDYMVPTAYVVLDHLPLTPHGKVDRRRLSSPDYRQRPRLGTDTAYVAPGNIWETHLTQLWARCLQVASVGIYDNFFDLGGDSITAIQIAAQATEAGLALSPQHMLQHLTVAGVLAQVEIPRWFDQGQEATQGETQGHTQEATQGETMGPVPLTPVQQSFFEQNLADPHHWNQSLLLDVAQPLEAAWLETALQRLVQHHGVLRFQFTLGESGWQQRHGASGSSPPNPLLTCVDLSQQSAEAQPEEVASGITEKMASTEAKLQTSLDLTKGKLLQAALFNRGDYQPQGLLLIIHHLVVDGVSWLTLLKDLDTFYRQAAGEAVAVPLPTMPFHLWAAGLGAAAAAFQSELAHWLRPAQGSPPSLLAKMALATNPDAASGATVISGGSPQTMTTCLSREDTRLLLKQMPQVAQVQVNEVLLLALALALGDNQQPLLVDVEGHGREEGTVPGANLVRTVGWFTSVFPLVLTLPQAGLGEQLQAVKEQVRQVPHNGIGYGLLRYLGAGPGIKAQLKALPQAEILFNYLGDLAGLVPPGSRFQLARGLQLSRSPGGQRRYLLEVNAAVNQGQLQVDWSYDQRLGQSTVEGWAHGLMEGVRSQITHYLSPDSPNSPGTISVTPTDFPLAQLNSQNLGKIAALLQQTHGSE